MKKIDNKSSIEKLAESIKDYNFRMAKIEYTKQSCTTDYLLKCPICGRQDMEFGVSGWNCLWRDCGFRLPDIFCKLIKRI